MPNFKSYHQERRTPPIGLFIKVFLALMMVLLIWFLSKEMLKNYGQVDSQSSHRDYLHFEKGRIYGTPQCAFIGKLSKEKISITDFSGKGMIENGNSGFLVFWHHDAGTIAFPQGVFGVYSNELETRIRVIDGDLIFEPGEAEIKYPKGSLIEIAPEGEHFRILDISRN